MMVDEFRREGSIIRVEVTIEPPGGREAIHGAPVAADSFLLKFELSLQDTRGG